MAVVGGDDDDDDNDGDDGNVVVINRNVFLRAIVINFTTVAAVVVVVVVGRGSYYWDHQAPFQVVGLASPVVDLVVGPVGLDSNPVVGPDWGQEDLGSSLVVGLVALGHWVQSCYSLGHYSWDHQGHYSLDHLDHSLGHLDHLDHSNLVVDLGLDRWGQSYYWGLGDHLDQNYWGLVDHLDQNY